MRPKFQHGCTHCQFLGHYNGHDVYLCGSGKSKVLGPSILARYGDEAHEYASNELKNFIRQFEDNSLVGSCGDQPTEPAQVALPRMASYMAWLQAFAMHGANELLAEFMESAKR